MNKKCIGCGSILQSENEANLGYIPLEKLLLEQDILCKRCFRLKHYGINKEETLPGYFYKQEVEKAIKKSDLVLVVVDIFDFESSFTDEILDIIRDNNSIILINKADLLPKNIIKNKLIDWLKERFSMEGISPYEISFISTKSVEGINGIIRKVVSYAKLKRQSNINASIIGVSNTGKSSIINRIIENNNLNNKKKSTVSKFSGTTIKNIKMSFKIKDVNITLYDTPGLIPQGRMIEMFDVDTALEIVPQNRLISKKYNLKNKDVLFITKHIIIEKISKIVDKNDVEYSNSFIVYASPFVKVHKTNSQKIENIKNSELLNITKNEKLLIDKYITDEIELNKNEEIAISGLCFITTANKCKLKITYPEGLKIVVRDEMLKVKNG